MSYKGGIGVENELLAILYIATFLWLFACAVRAVYRLARGEQQSVLFVILVHFVFTGIPLLLDVLIGVPLYPYFPGFRLAQTDVVTGYIYCAYVSIVPIVLTTVGRRGTSTWRLSSWDPGPLSQSRTLQLILVSLMIAPVAVVLIAPDPGIYLNYAVSLRTDLRTDVRQYHDVVVLFARYSLIAAAGLSLIKRQVKVRYGTLLLRIPILLLVSPFILIDIWLIGKRSVMALTLLLVGYILWRHGVLRKWRLVVAGLLAVAMLMAFSFSYQSSIRDVGVRSADFWSIYENVRIDFGRDDVIKTAIYSELYPDKLRILEYRGQSIVFYATMYVPRALWPNKPYTYATYMTAAAMMTEPRPLGWGVTTSALDEAIANFGWFGMVLGPLGIALICRIGDRRRDAVLSMITTVIACLSMVLELVAFAPVVLLWVVLLVRKPRTRKIPRWEGPADRMTPDGLLT